VNFFPLLFNVDQFVSSLQSGVGGIVIGFDAGAPVIGFDAGAPVIGFGPPSTGMQKSIRALKLMNPFDCSKSSAVVIIPEAL